jgi:hypothetical protein
MLFLLTDKTSITSKSLDDASDYFDEDIAILENYDIDIQARSNFRESWLFNVYSLDG